MAKDHKGQGPSGSSNAASANEHCKSEECKKSAAKFGFCAEHYEMYMAGVIRGDGKKPSDYNEKLKLFQRQQEKSKVA